MELAEFIAGDGVQLACYRGRQLPDRPKVLLVHGYPDSAAVWQPCMSLLERHFNVFAYDVRGCGRSEAPARVADYAYDHLVRDLKAVVNAVSPGQPVHVVAHDWGSIQVWEAVTRPDMAKEFASFTSISGPCLDHASLWLRECLEVGGAQGRRDVLGQLRKSWYTGFFQLPVLAPSLWTLFGQRAWPGMLQRLGEATPPASHSRTRDGANGVNLYRANFRRKLFSPEPRETTVPVQLLVPKDDPFIGASIYQAIPKWCRQFERHDIDAGHWVITKHAAWVADRVIDFVQRIGADAAAQEAPVAL